VYLLITGFVILAYLCGSLSGAIILSHVLNLPNPRCYGSLNPGATNMFRINGKLVALFVLIFDMLKGMIPVWMAYRLGISPLFLGIVAIVACLGHIYPCFFNFHGGKGVATAFGAMSAIGFEFTSAFSITWLVATLVTGYSSIGAITSFIVAPFYVWLFRPELTLPVAMLSCLIFARHASNIQRLLKGEEPKIWRKKNNNQKLND